MADSNAIREITSILETGVQGLFESGKYADYLKTMSNFHRYSTRNTLLIHLQKPGATHVAGKDAWTYNFERQLKEGEHKHAIKILAPTPHVTDYRLPKTARFKVINVYDLSQTEGKPLPTLAQTLTGNIEQYDDFMDALRAVSPLPIAFEPLPDDKDGVCRYGDKIALREGMSEVQTVSAAIHEMTHAKLHSKKKKDQRIEEVEAESVSYVVCQYYGIDTGANSFGYLAEWSRGRDLKELNASLDRIRKAAAELIDGIDEQFRALAIERQHDNTLTAAHGTEREQAAKQAPPAISVTSTPGAVYARYCNQVADYARSYEAYANAILNADEQNARDECERAVARAVVDIASNNMEHGELLNNYADDNFKGRLEDYVFTQTYLAHQTAQRNAVKEKPVAVPTIVAEYARNAAVSNLQRVGANVLMMPVFDDGNFNRDGKRIRVTVEQPIGKYQMYSRVESGEKKWYFLTASGRIDNTHWHFPSVWDEQQHKRIDHIPTEAELDDALVQFADRFESAMSNPAKWAMFQHAAALNRLDDCEAHNAPIRVQREEEQQRNHAAGEKQRQEEKQQKQERFDARIDEIATAISKNAEISVKYNEYEFDGKNPVLDLFRLYGVELPLRTQGWVNTRLAAITESGYRYSSSKGKGSSDTFSERLYDLRKAIKAIPIEQKRQSPVEIPEPDKEDGGNAYSHTHWLKIPLTASTRNENRMYQEIQSYLDRYDDAAATIFMYENSLLDYVVKLECNQDWNDLDLDANTGSHSLTRLTRKPDNIINPQPFTIPEWLTQDERKEEPQVSTAKHEDFGEKIGGAKKDLWRQRGLQSGDLADMNEREADKYVTKDNVWKKPNYQALIDGGVPADVAYYIKTVRDSLDTSPIYRRTDNTPELRQARQAEYIDTICEIKAVVEAVKTKEDVHEAFNRCMIEGGYYEKVQPGMSGYYASPTEKGRVNAAITDKLSRAMFIRNERDYAQKLTQKAEKAQFGVSKEAKIPAGYDVLFNDGKYTWSASKDWKPETFYVVRRNRILETNFESRDAALRWVQNFAKEQGGDGKKRFVPPQLESIERTGPDFRQDRDIVGDDYLTTFGFKGGEHGNWMSQLDRQASLNYGYDAFKDLAAALKISDNDISYQGALSIAFGARGSGNAAAHYEPLRNVINLTKMNGAGSLAHEWWHGLDDYLGSKLGAGKGYFSEQQRTNPLAKKLIDTIKYKPATPEQAAAAEELANTRIRRNAERWTQSYLMACPKDASDDVKAEYANLHEAFLRGEEGSVEKLSDLRKKVAGRVIPKSDKQTLEGYERLLHSMNEKKEPTVRNVETDYYRNSKEMGKITERDGGYWDSNVEMTARAFATYILDTLPYRSDYLVGHAEGAVNLTMSEDGKLEILRAYPEGEERKAINAVFDEIIAELKLQQHLTHDEQVWDSPANPEPDRQLYARIVDGEVMQTAQTHKFPSGRYGIATDTFNDRNYVANINLPIFDTEEAATTWLEQSDKWTVVNSPDIAEAEPQTALEENDMTKGAPMEYSELQQKGFEIAKRYEHLPMQDRLNIIAQTFNCKTASVTTVPCRGKYRGYSDIMLTLDNGASLGIGMYGTPKARTAKVQSECVNNTLARFNPEIVSEIQARAAAALSVRQAEDNAVAAQMGLKPYTFLGIGLNDGSEQSGYVGWYYATIAVDGNVLAFIESGLNYDIARGVLGEQISRPNYFVAGGLRDNEVDFVFNNVGHSSFNGSHQLLLTKEARQHAEKLLNERGQPAAMDMTKTMEHQLYDKFAAMFPEFMRQEYSTLLLEAEHATPLRLEWIFGDQFFISHSTDHDGTRHHNPMVMLSFNDVQKTVTAISLDLTDPPRKDVVYKAPGEADLEMQRNINTFTFQWLDRAAAQRFMPVEATFDVDENGNLSKAGLVTDKTVTVAFDADGKAIMPEPEQREVQAGDVLLVEGKQWLVEKIDGDFSIDLKNLDPNDIQSNQKLMGRWKQKLENAGYTILDKPEPVQAEKQYDLDYGFLGIGITVWNRAEAIEDGFATVAHINPDRTVTFYDTDMPHEVKQQIDTVAKSPDTRAFGFSPAPENVPPRLDGTPAPAIVYETIKRVLPETTQPKVATLDMSLPDPAWTVPEMHEYGYTQDDMYPLSVNRALELFDTEHPIYMLWKDNTEMLALDRDEIITFSREGFCGITKADWEMSPVRAAQMAVAANAEGSRESGLLYGDGNRFGIYQIRDGIDEAQNLRFTPMRELEALGLTPNRANYELVYTAPFSERVEFLSDRYPVLNRIYQDFNTNQPADFTARSVSVSDVVVLKCNSDISSHFVNDTGFVELDGFLGNETPNKPELEPPAPTVTEPEADMGKVIPISAAKADRKPAASKSTGNKSLLDRLERGKQRAAQQKPGDAHKKNPQGRYD